jgi:hypothetical protein
VAVAHAAGGFWLQHASREARELVGFADELAQTTQHSRPGIAFGPVNAPSTLNGLFQRARQLGDAILDPHGYLLDRDATRRAQQHFPWLAQAPRPATRQQWEAWMLAALNHQLSADLRGRGPGPSFVITASPLMEAVRGTLELYEVLDAAEAIRAQTLAARLDCWIGVSVDRVYLREPTPLTSLANSMLATGADGFVFRAAHNQLAPVDDARYLAGLREIVVACASNGIRIFLPGAGWLGWLAMAWGAWGFSGGMAASTWVDRVPGPMTRPQRPSEPYYEPQLLRTVPWRVHRELARTTGYRPCPCPECRQMGGVYDLALAKRHQLRHAHAEGTGLARLGPRQREDYVGRRLDGAIAFRDALPLPIRGRVSATFLDRWRDLV